MTSLSTVKARMRKALEPHAVVSHWGDMVQCACDLVERTQADYTRHLGQVAGEEAYKIQQAAAATRPPNPIKRRTEPSEFSRPPA